MFAPGYGPPPAAGPGPGPGHHPYGEPVHGGGYAYVIREEEAPPPRPSAPRPSASQPQPQEPPAFGHRDPGRPAPDDPAAAPGPAYSPGDPAYGPPSPGWYSTEAQAGQQTAEEIAGARGAFEPAPKGDSGQDPGADDPPRGTPLEQLEDFYLTAEASSPENLNRHFDELLERQRRLISEFFTGEALQESPR